MSRVSVTVGMGAAAVGGFVPEGFGKDAYGGQDYIGSPTVVSNLNDSGAGSLRAALSASNRYITFSVGGTITLSSSLGVSGSYITIDGTTASSPGITINGNLWFETAHHIVVRGLRVRDAGVNNDDITVYDCHDMLFDHCSMSHTEDGADGCIDITAGSYNITTQWCITSMRTDASDGGNSLCAYSIYNISSHHNIMSGQMRLPLVKWSEGGDEASSMTCDIVNNIIWGWGVAENEDPGHPAAYWQPGITADGGAHINVVNCFFQSDVPVAGIPEGAIALDVYFGSNAKAYTSGNFSGNGVNLNDNGNVGSAFSATAIGSMTTALNAVTACLAAGGARGPLFGLDATDQAVVDDITTNAVLS